MSSSLMSLLHLCDSLFPVGTFAYSDGMESAADARLLVGADDLEAWLAVVLDETLGRCEGPGVATAWSAHRHEHWERLAIVDEELIAMRPSATARIASASTGLRLLKTWAALYPEPRFDCMLALVEQRTLAPALPVAFGAVCSSAGIDRRAALEAFAYTRLAAGVSAAMRLLPIGQHRAHALLAGLLARVPATVDLMMARNAPPESFTPSVDIASMTHQYVHSRLFRS